MDLFSDIVDMLWESSQNRRINEVRREVNELRETARSSAASDPTRAGLDELRATCGELRLCVAVLLRALDTKGILSRDELVRLADELDKEDGRVDRSYSGEVLPRTNS